MGDRKPIIYTRRAIGRCKRQVSQRVQQLYRERLHIAHYCKTFIYPYAQLWARYVFQPATPLQVLNFGHVLTLAAALAMIWSLNP